MATKNLARKAEKALREARTEQEVGAEAAKQVTADQADAGHESVTESQECPPDPPAATAAAWRPRDEANAMPERAVVRHDVRGKSIPVDLVPKNTRRAAYGLAQRLQPRLPPWISRLQNTTIILW